MVVADPRMSKVKVYILGAGCSANYGYPLAKDFRTTLKGYQQTLNNRPRCEHLECCVADSLRLLEEFNSPTIDRLALQIEERLDRDKRAVPVSDGAEHSRLEQEANGQILDAKIATAALFLEREYEARKIGLQGYRDFLNTVFEGHRDPDVLGTTPVRVMSYNYDRLFEIAFADHFRLDSSVDWYGPGCLNSGVDFIWKRAATVAPDRFSFLKLHGTAGIWVADRHGLRTYGCVDFPNARRIIDDDFIWPHGREARSSPSQSEPLIVFPFEKERARERRTAFLYDQYLQAIWEQAMRLAEQAHQIWVIGYSFDPNDRKSALELLRKNAANCEVVVQNRSADELCKSLGLTILISHPGSGPSRSCFDSHYERPHLVCSRAAPICKLRLWGCLLLHFV